MQTVLDMTQEILSAMSSDEVNSIGDTTESLQVATILKRTYLNIITRLHLPEHDQFINLTPSNDVAMPTLMYVPQEVTDIKWIKYFDSNNLDGTTPNTYEHDLNTDIVSSSGGASTSPPGYLYITILPVQEFVALTNRFNPEDTNVESFTFTDNINSFPGNFTFYYKTNTQPRFCTFVSNKYLIFDAFDSTQDSTLQSTKTLCWGQVAPTFRLEDDFIPRLGEQEFPLLVNEAKALAFYELKQMPHQKAEQESKRQWSSVQRNKSVDKVPTPFQQLPDFGRRGQRSGAYGGPYWHGKRY